MFHVEQKNYKMNLKTFIREVPDFPRKGINFIDITTMLKNPDAFGFVVDNIFNEFKDKNITKVVSLESRGFIFGGAVAYRLNAGFVPVRKRGKLPAETFSKQLQSCNEGELLWVPQDQIFSLKLIGFIRKILPFVLEDDSFVEGTIFHDMQGNIIKEKLYPLQKLLS